MPIKLLMKRNWIFIMTAALSYSAAAQDLVDTQLNDGLVLKVPASSVDKAKKAFDTLSKNMQSCSPVLVEYNDPIIDRKNTIVISKASNGLCLVTWVKDALWKYDCNAPTLSRKKWVSIFDARINSDQYFGDFTESEKEILFDVKTCTAKRQS